MGLINEPDYCLKVDANVSENKIKNFISDYNPEGLARELMSHIGNDLMPKHINKDMP